VADGENGRVCDPSAQAVADAFSWFADHRDQARAYGLAGRALAGRITWDDAVERLLAA
jgi:glycosyltransferase involved in cell wall biosynthesis